MAALTGNRATSRKEGSCYVLPIADGATIFSGALVAINADGAAVPAAKAADQTAAGCALFVDAAANRVTVERGCFLWENDTASPVAEAHVGGPCYMLDDQTVTSVAEGSSVAGKVIGLEDGQVLVETL